jgi:hypothetical protein
MRGMVDGTIDQVDVDAIIPSAALLQPDIRGDLDFARSPDTGRNVEL